MTVLQLYTYSVDEQRSTWVGDGGSQVFSLLEWEVTDKQSGKAKMNHVVLDESLTHQYELCLALTIDGCVCVCVCVCIYIYI